MNREILRVHLYLMSNNTYIEIDEWSRTDLMLDLRFCNSKTGEYWESLNEVITYLNLTGNSIVDYVEVETG